MGSRASRTSSRFDDAQPPRPSRPQHTEPAGAAVGRPARSAIAANRSSSGEIRRRRADSARPGSPRSSASAWPAGDVAHVDDVQPGGAPRSRGCCPVATPAIMRPVGVGFRSPSPTGVVGFTTTASSSRARKPLGRELRPLVGDRRAPRRAARRASVAGRPATGPHVPAVLVWTKPAHALPRPRLEHVARAFDVHPLRSRRPGAS